MAVLNKKQVNALFQCYAVLLGTEDRVSEFRVTILFGPNAVKFAKTTHNGQYHNGFGVGDCTIMYFTYQGFLAAASYYNAQQLRGEAKA